MLLETIKRYHSAGLVIIPLLDKRPSTRDWQNQEWQPKLDLAVFKNTKSAGFVIPSDYLVIDVDNHENQQGSITLKEMSKHYNFDFFNNAKIIIKTASGGYHLYFKLDCSAKIPNTLRRFPSVEFKHKGRQVVIPDSILSDGRTYSYHMLSEIDFKKISVLPEKIVRDLEQNFTQTPVEDNEIKRDLTADIQAFEQSLKEIKLNKGDRNNQMYVLACQGQERGLSKETTLKILSEFNKSQENPLGAVELKSVVSSGFKYSKSKVANYSVSMFEEINETELNNLPKETREDWFKELKLDGKKKEPSRSKFGTYNTQIFLENVESLKNRLAVNLFSMDTIWRKPAHWHKKQAVETDKVVDDDDIIRIRQELNNNNFDPSPAQIIEAVRATSLRHEYHPVKEYFENIPEWDRVERLKNFFPEYCGSDRDSYSEQIGIKIFTAIVARIYSPGIKFDYLPIIIGVQGLGKSTMLEAIAIKPQWYTDNLGDIENKDVILRMRSKLIVENAELTMFEKSDANNVKAFLSRRVDRDRLPYDRLPRDLPRQCIVFATTNKDRFLQDETGNRRMWPIEVKDIKLERIKQDLPKFYAEAVFRFKNGEQLFLDDVEAELIAKKVQSERYDEDEWQAKVEEFLNTNPSEKLTIADIWENCFQKDISNLYLREKSRIGKILRRLGYDRKSFFDPETKKVINGFRKKLITT